MTAADTELLILGAGWLSTFLIPLCKERKLSYVATTRDGRGDTIRFTYDEQHEDEESFKVLPSARDVLITFPIKTSGATERFVQLYLATHDVRAHFCLLGSTGIWDASGWTTRHSPFDRDSPRARSEEELLAATPEACVLNLSGLWGGSRSVRRFLLKVVPDKASLQKRTSIHFVHGEDVSRGILAAFADWHRVRGQRWILTDCRVHDWWELMSDFGDAGVDGEGKAARGPAPDWVLELMRETGVKSLPRTPEQLGRAVSSIEFWETLGLFPRRGRPS